MIFRSNSRILTIPLLRSLITSFLSNLRLWASIALVPWELLEVYMYICFILLLTVSVFSSTFCNMIIKSIEQKKPYLDVSLVFLHVLSEQLDIPLIYHYILESLAFIISYKATDAACSTSHVWVHRFCIGGTRCGRERTMRIHFLIS